MADDLENLLNQLGESLDGLQEAISEFNDSLQSEIGNLFTSTRESIST